MKSGFLLTSIMNREERAFREFNDKLGGMVFESNIKEVSHTSNFERLLADELRALKIREDFGILEKFRSILLLGNRTKHTPAEIFKKLRSSRAEFYNILRIVPLEFLTKFNQEAIEKYILKNTFEGTYKIVYEGRLCPSDLKEKIFQIIIPLVPCEVKLENPDFVIVVQAFKGFIGLAVMENDPANFNFSSKSEFQGKARGKL